MVARGLLATLGVAAVAAAAQGQGAHLSAGPSLRRLQGEEGSKITTLDPAFTNSKINEKCFGNFTEMRKRVSLDALSGSASTPDTDLTDFKGNVTCAEAISGTFRRQWTGTHDIFVFSLSPTSPKRLKDDTKCSTLVNKVWTEGIKALGNELPPAYEDPVDAPELLDSEAENKYKSPAAAALVALLHDKTSLQMFCGDLNEVTECKNVKSANTTLLCYLKGADLVKGPAVSAKVWGKVLREAKETKNNMPIFVGQNYEQNLVQGKADYIDKITEFRSTYGLDKVEAMNPPDSFHTITCQDLTTNQKKPAKVNKFFYAVGSATESRSVDPDFTIYWKEALKKFRGQPPAYTDEIQAYLENDQRGAAILLSRKIKKIFCKKFTGCGLTDGSPDKTALLCAIDGSEQVFEEAHVPVDTDVWEKVERDVQIVPNFEPITAGDLAAFFEETNKFRKRAKLDPLGETPARTRRPRSEESYQGARAVSCYALSSGEVDPLKEGAAQTEITEPSLMYYLSDEGTQQTANGADAFKQWEEGYEKLKNMETLPPYIYKHDPYDDGSVNNFVSIASPSAKSAKCYATKGCIKEGVVCEITPSVFKNDTVPIPPESWTEIKRAKENETDSGDNEDSNDSAGSGSGASPLTVGSLAAVAGLVAAALLL